MDDKKQKPATYVLTLRCVCGATRVFRGPGVDAVIKAIDESGWRDRPRPDTDLCPNCLAAEEDDEDGYYWG